MAPPIMTLGEATARTGMVVNCAAYAEGRKIGDVDVAHVGEVLQRPEQFVWIGLHEPDALRRSIAPCDASSTSTILAVPTMIAGSTG